jgi:hypothetical protein
MAFEGSAGATCLPTNRPTSPSGADWLHEVKYDGYRLRLERDGERVRLITRGGYNWNNRYPWIVEAALKNRFKRFVIERRGGARDRRGWRLDVLHSSGERRVNPMPNPKEPYQLDVAMIARLEEANARAYKQKQFANVDETVFESQQDVARHPSDQQKSPAIPDQQSSRSRAMLLALIVLPLAASACLAAFAWRSSSRDLANMERQIEQLKTSQEQMIRDNTAVAEQLKAELAQMVRDNATVAEQLLKASQEQLATVMSFWTASSAQKPLRKRKPVPLLPSPQAGARPQAPVQ